MTWPEFLAYARGVKQNNRQAPPTAPKRIELFDVQDQTASAKLTASWGTDYLLLGKYNGKWMISSVMWQSLPPRPPPAGGGNNDGGGEEVAVEPFEPDLLATDNVFRGTFAPDGRTFFFFRKVAKNRDDEDYRILESRLVSGRWTAPTRVSLGGDYSDLYPTISPDGRRMVFSSYRPARGDTSSHRNAHLWYADRSGDGWGTPVFMGKASLLGYYNSGPQFLSDGSVHWNATTPDWRSQQSVHHTVERSGVRRAPGVRAGGAMAELEAGSGGLARASRAGPLVRDPREWRRSKAVAGDRRISTSPSAAARTGPSPGRFEAASTRGRRRTS